LHLGEKLNQQAYKRLEQRKCPVPNMNQIETMVFRVLLLFALLDICFGASDPSAVRLFPALLLGKIKVYSILLSSFIFNLASIIEA